MSAPVVILAVAIVALILAVTYLLDTVHRLLDTQARHLETMRALRTALDEHQAWCRRCHLARLTEAESIVAWSRTVHPLLGEHTRQLRALTGAVDDIVLGGRRT